MVLAAKSQGSNMVRVRLAQASNLLGGKDETSIVRLRQSDPLNILSTSCPHPVHSMETRYPAYYMYLLPKETR